MSSRKQFRFTSAQDLSLLKEVAATNPYAIGNTWEAVSEILNGLEDSFQISARRARERTQLLLEVFLKEDTVKLKRSGTSEQLTEKENLPREINDLKVEAEDSRKASAVATATARKICDAAMGAMKGEGSGTEVQVKKKKKTMIEFLEDKSRAEASFRQEQLRFEEKRLQLEREKFEAEKEERTARLRLEREERLQMLQILTKLTQKEM